MVKTKDEAAMLKYLGEHIKYERDMLAFCYAKLHNTRPGLEWNAFYEAFGIHARNIYNFLRNDGGTTTTFRADQYVQSWKRPGPLLKFNGLDLFLFHMSKSRLEHAKLDLQRLKELGKWLDDEWAKWVGALSGPYAAILKTDPVCPANLTLDVGVTLNTACVAITTSSVSDVGLKTNEI